MMSGDPYIQDPLSSQSYNRYTYVWNNPTNMTDPTGFEAMAASTSQYADKDGNCDKRCQQLQDDLEREKRKNSSGWGVQSNSRSADNTGGAGAANSGTEKIVRSPDYLRALVPGQVQWDDARTDFANGRYGGAILHLGLMLAEQGLTVLTFGEYQAGITAVRATTTVAKSEITIASRSVNPCKCFIAGTPVHTKDGLKLIEEIKVGDFVAAVVMWTDTLLGSPFLVLFDIARRNLSVLLIVIAQVLSRSS